MTRYATSAYYAAVAAATGRVKDIATDKDVLPGVRTVAGTIAVGVVMNQ